LYNVLLYNIVVINIKIYKNNNRSLYIILCTIILLIWDNSWTLIKFAHCSSILYSSYYILYQLPYSDGYIIKTIVIIWKIEKNIWRTWRRNKQFCTHVCSVQCELWSIQTRWPRKLLQYIKINECRTTWFLRLLMAVVVLRCK